MLTDEEALQMDRAAYANRARKVITAFDAEAPGDRSPRYQDAEYNTRLMEVKYHESELRRLGL